MKYLLLMIIQSQLRGIFALSFKLRKNEKWAEMLYPVQEVNDYLQVIHYMFEEG